MPQTQKHKNRLFLARHKNNLARKQVALLLGHQTSDQISRYERGAKLPSLKTALLLGTIYRLPIRVLFDGYYEACLKELKKREKSFSVQTVAETPTSLKINGKIEYCSIEENLKPLHISEENLEKARRHITELLKLRAEKMHHL